MLNMDWRKKNWIHACHCNCSSFKSNKTIAIIISHYENEKNKRVERSENEDGAQCWDSTWLNIKYSRILHSPLLQVVACFSLLFVSLFIFFFHYILIGYRIQSLFAIENSMRNTQPNDFWGLLIVWCARTESTSRSLCCLLDSSIIHGLTFLLARHHHTHSSAINKLMIKNLFNQTTRDGGVGENECVFDSQFSLSLTWFSSTNLWVAMLSGEGNWP